MAISGNWRQQRERAVKTVNVNCDRPVACTQCCLLWLPGLTDTGLSVAQEAMLAFVLISFGFLESFRNMIWLRQALTFGIWVCSRLTVVPMMSWAPSTFVVTPTMPGPQRRLQSWEQRWGPQLSLFLGLVTVLSQQELKTQLGNVGLRPGPPGWARTLESWGLDLGKSPSWGWPQGPLCLLSYTLTSGSPCWYLQAQGGKSLG